VPIEKRVIARMAGSYGVLFPGCANMQRQPAFISF
jgi:hypothetical protein